MKNLLIIAFLIALVGCQDEGLTKSSSQSTVSAGDGQVSTPHLYYASWIYVMDARFSSATCATGPGVCFKNGFGDIWDYAFFDNSLSGDVGPVGVKVDDEKLHMSFFRSLEEDSFIVEEDVQLNDKLANALGKNVIVIKAGKYRVTFDNYKYGEALVDMASK